MLMQMGPRPVGHGCWREENLDDPTLARVRSARNGTYPRQLDLDLRYRVGEHQLKHGDWMGRWYHTRTCLQFCLFEYY